jgi:hypothetical protein
MGFQFKNINTGYLYSINEIDEIAAKFWGVEVDPKYYACPNEWASMNWFDCIGHGIEDLQYIYTLDMNGKKKYHHGINGEPEFKMIKVISMVLFESTAWGSFKSIDHAPYIYQPFIKLCEHLDELGIVGVGCGW